jgi:hypothetical protein
VDTVGLTEGIMEEVIQWELVVVSELSMVNIMEIKNIKEMTMLQRLLDKVYFIMLVVSLVLLFIGTGKSQTIDAPIGYTTFLGLRQYAYEANPGADSLNANNTLIDNNAKAVNDTLTAIRSDLYSVISYSGGITDGSVTWADMSTSAKATIVQVTGTQSIAGAKIFTDGLYTDGITPNASLTYNLGKIDEMWKTVYTQRVSTNGIAILNPTGTDSVVIGYDGTDVQFNKPVTVADFYITESISMDSAASFNSLKLYGDTYTPVLVGDSILVIDALQANIRIAPPGDMTRVIGMSMEGASEGTIVVLYNTSGLYSVTLKDDIPSLLYGENDHNLFKMTGDFTLGAMDNITFKYTYNDSDLANQWMEISRSDN